MEIDKKKINKKGNKMLKPEKINNNDLKKLNKSFKIEYFEF